MENSDKNRTKLVDGVFTSIYKKYDLMNDVISLGYHRITLSPGQSATRGDP